MTRHHTLTVRLENESFSVHITCPHDHDLSRARGRSVPWDVPSCACWSAAPECICDCEACAAGAHDDCEQDAIDEVGRKWCQATPDGQCWYTHAVDEQGLEMLAFPLDGLVASWPVTLVGNSWDDPIEVDVVEEGASDAVVPMG